MIKILTLDIETSPNLAYVWGLWKQTIPPSALVDSKRVLCFAAKWLDKPKVYWGAGDEGILLAHELLDEADVVVTYNGTAFDIPHLNTEFTRLQLDPPAPFQQIDLLKTVRKQFNFPSTKLEYVVQALDVGMKHSAGGFETWVGCLNDDPASWRLMKKYNQQDVKITEALYLKLLPWITGHPSRQLYDGGIDCPVCGGPAIDVTKRGFYRTRLSKFQRYQCQNCGSWLRGSRRVAGVDIQEAVI